MRLGLVFAVSLVLVLAAVAALAAKPADAHPAIKVSNCRIYDTNRVDPIAFSAHLHYQFGNTSTTNQSTGTSLFNHKSTSCNADWFTTAGWFPTEKREPVKGVNVYYRAPGDQTKVKPIPTGLQLLGTKQEYRCNTGPGEESWKDTPPYGCKQEWGTRVIFPDCWNEKSLQETTTVYSKNGRCPKTHPYRIPQVNYLIMHKNKDRVVHKPLRVSMGKHKWGDYTMMHADYFAANQSVFDNKLIGLCLRNAPDSVTYADPRCGKGP